MSTVSGDRGDEALRQRVRRILRAESPGRSQVEWLGLGQDATPAELRARALERYLSALGPGGPARARVRELAGLTLLLEGAPVPASRSASDRPSSQSAGRNVWDAVSLAALVGGPLVTLLLLGVVAFVGNVGRTVDFPRSWTGTLGGAPMKLTLEASPGQDGRVVLLGTSALATGAGPSTRPVSGTYDPAAGILTLQEGAPEELVALRTDSILQSAEAPCDATLSGQVAASRFEGMWTCGAISRNLVLLADLTGP